MLTKNLLQYKVRQGRVYPQFVDLSDSQVDSDARTLKNAFETAEGKSLSEIDATVSDAPINMQLPLNQALKKLLQDRCEYQPDDGAIASRRLKLIEAAQALRDQCDFQTSKSFQREFFRLHEYRFEQDSLDLYGDLESLRVISKFEDLEVPALLHRYNCALIQGLLLQAKSLHLTIESPSIEEQRLLTRRLKFFRLLAEIETTNKGTELIISGPLQIFQNAQTYGLRLANFFPHVLFLKKWHLKAEVTVKKRNYALKLDSSLSIESHYQWQPQYIPEEYTAFLQTFNDQSQNWQGTLSCDALNLGGQSLAFPDLKFTNKSQNHVFLEIFHKWHAKPFLERAEFISRSKNAKIILAIHKSLKAKHEYAEVFERLKEFNDKLLFFSDFPLPSQILTTLEKTNKEDRDINSTS